MNAVVKGIMTPNANVVTVKVDTPFEAVAAALRRADVLAAYARTDAGIAVEIRAGIMASETRGTLDVSVTAGLATIVGRPRTREQGHAIISQARHVQGVVAVRDRLDYRAPVPARFDALASSFPSSFPSS
jgi:hypothetical protein